RYLRDEHADWQEVDQTAILAFLDQLKKQGVAQETINRHIVSLRQLYKFLRLTGQVDSNPLAQLTTAATPA
ncbi:site-specific integrase, partial [[Ruminococcus] torques]|uniref:site-specific integrase n=1 Tax=[Ruminococcus] torques TaxID=33039 RepID=UPI001EDEB584